MTPNGATGTRTLTSDSQLLQDYLQSTGILVNTNGESVAKVAALLNAEGQTEAVVIDPAGSVYHACREPLSDSGWNMYGIGAGFQMIAAVDAATLWAIGNDGGLWRGDHGRWTQTQTLSGNNLALSTSAGPDGTVWALAQSGVFVKGPAAAAAGPATNVSITPVLTLDAGARLVVFCIDTSGALWTNRQAVPGGGWGAWTVLGMPPGGATLTRFAAAANQDGSLQLFAIGSDAVLYTASEQSAAGGWSAWAPLGGTSSTAASLAVARNADGRLEVFAVVNPDAGGVGAVAHFWQSWPNGSWSGWLDMGMSASGLTVGLDTSGFLELLAFGNPESTAGFWTRQTGPWQPWTQWQALGAPTAHSLRAPVVLPNAGGDLEVFTLDSHGALWHLWKEGDGWFATWERLGGICRSLSACRNQDGRLEIFAEGTDGALWHIWQTSPANGWSTWHSLGKPTEDTISETAVVLNQVGSLEVVALGASNTPWHIAQNGSLGWTGWTGQWWCWYPMPFGVPELKGAPTGTNGNAWAIAASGALVHWSGGGAWSSVSLPNGLEAACVAVDGEGGVWILASDASGTFFSWADGDFLQLPAGLPGAVSLSVSSASTIRATAAVEGGQYALFAYGTGAWQAVGSPPLGDVNWNNDPQVSVGRDGSVWLLDGTGNAFKERIQASGWSWSAHPVSTAQVRLAHVAAGRRGSAWGVDTSGGIWQFNGSWIPFRHPLPAGTVAQVSPGPRGTVSAIDTSGHPWSYRRGSWQRAPEALGAPLVQAPTRWAIGARALYRHVIQREGGATTAAWQRIRSWSAFTAAQLSVGSDDSVFVLDTDGRLWNCAGPPALVRDAPTGLLQVAVVNANVIWGIARSRPGGSCALHLLAGGAWRRVETSTPFFSAAATAPLLSSSGDGTVWLLDTSGVSRRLEWSPRRVEWAPSSGAAVLSIAAANASSAAPVTAQVHEAWGVSAGCAFRKSFGNGWVDAGTSLPSGAAAAQVSVGADGSIWALDDQNGLYRQQSWSQPPTPAPAGSASLIAGQGTNGLLSLCCLDGSGQAWVTTKPAGGHPWPDWTALPATESFADLAAGADSGGALNVIALSTSGLAYGAAQSGASSTGWSAWSALGSQPDMVTFTSLAVGRDASKTLHLFGLTSAGGVWTVQQQGSGWGDWTALPSAAPATFARLATGQDQGGTLEVFALDTGGVAHHSWQVPSGWSDWSVLGAAGQPPGPIALAGLATANQEGGPLLVVCTGSDGAVYAASREASSPTGWSDWVSLGNIPGVRPLALATANGPNGVVLVFVQGSDGAIYGATQEPGSEDGWNGWQPMGAMGTRGVPLRNPCTAVGDDAVLRAFALGAGSVWQNRAQPGSPTGWGDWSRLSGGQPWQPCGVQSFAQMPTGSAAALWAVFADGTVRISADGGSAWTPVPFPDSGAPAPAVGVSVGIDGAIWAVTATACYQYVSGAWQAAGTGRFARAPVGSAHDLWAVDPSGRIWRSTNGGGAWWHEASYTGTASELSMCPDGSVWALDRDGTASLASAWQRIMRPTGMQGYAQATSCAEVVAGRDEHGTRHVFLVAPENGNLYHSYELFHHAWTQPTALASTPVQVSNIGVTNQQDTGELIVYAPPTSGTIQVATKAPGHRYEFALRAASSHWGLVHWHHSLESATLDLCALDAEHWYWLSIYEGGLVARMTSAAPESVYFAGVGNAAGATPPLTWNYRLPWPRPAAPFCAAVDGSGQIWMISEIEIHPYPSTDAAGRYAMLTGPSTPIANGVVLTAAVLQADAWTPPEPRIYALAGNTAAGAAPALWMLSWTNVFASPFMTGTWSPWTPLGGSYAALFAGPPLAPTDTLLAVDGATGSLDALRQNPMTGAWRDGIVKRPSWSGDDIEIVPMYQTDATLYGATGVPEGGVPVTITAATPVDAWINNTLYPLEPHRGVVVKTDAMGKLHVRTLADGLHTPSLTFVAAGLGGPGATAGTKHAGVSLAPSAHVYAFLHGTGALPVGGGGPTTLTPGALANATVNGQRLNPSMTSQTAQPIVDTITTIAKIPSGASAPGAARLLRLAMATEGLPGGFWSNVWDGIKHFGEAIAHAIEKGIVDAAISIEHGVVHLSIYVAGQIVAVFRMIVKTVEDAVRAIEMIVATLIADVEQFIKWLMLLFDWENILKTQRAMRSFVEQAASVLDDKIGAVEQQVAAVFSGIQANVQQALQSIAASGRIGGYQHFGDLPTSFAGLGLAPRAGALASAPGAQPIHGSSSAHHNWLLTRVLAHVTPSFAIPAIPGLDPQAFLEALDFQNTLDAVQQAGADLLDFFKTIFTDPTSFATQGIVDLLGAIESLVMALIDLVEGLIEAFLALAQAILGGMVEALRHAVDIPLIGTLFELLTGEDMTLLNLGTLLAAVPIYILYEIAFGGMPFSGLGGDGAAVPGESGAQQWANVYMVAGVVNSVITAFADALAITLTPWGDEKEIPGIADLLKLMSVVVAVIMQIAGWPDDAGFPLVSGESLSAAQVAIWFNYAVYWGVPLVTVASSKLPVLGGDTQNLINTLFGITAMIAAVVALFEGLRQNPPIVNPADAAELAVGPIGLSLAWLMVAEIREGIWETSDGAADPAWLVFVVDLLVNLAVPILNEVSVNT